METLQLRRHFSVNIITRMIILALISAAVLVWKLDFINDVYFRNQLTSVGIVINGAIIVLFLVGLLRMLSIFIHYAREEAALTRFVRNLARNLPDPARNISARTLIARRYRNMESLFDANCPINHNALASTMVAAESTRNSLPKFINNVLILTGVFGTIVSLSIALIGASDMLASAVDVGGMGMVVHGMSTALSTTITAIVCYLYFGYFYLKLMDVQTNLVSGIEQVTTKFLMPKFQVQTDSVLYEFSGLIRSLQGLVGQMESTQSTFQAVEKRLLHTLENYGDRLDNVSRDMGGIQQLLKSGFRLPEES